MYDVIVLGATFAAAGMAQVLNRKCLILDSKPCAGYEFLSALHFGFSYDKPIKSEEGQKLYEIFEQRQALTKDRVCLFDCAAPFYKLLEGLPVLLNMQIISVTKDSDGFVCLVHGATGYRTFRAKRVVDTRCISGTCSSKTYNFLVDGEGRVDLPESVKYERWGLSCNYILRCQVQLEADYQEGRKAALEVIRSLPRGHKVVLLADEFDYTVRDEYPKSKNGIMYLPSKAYENPVLAFDAGICFAKGGELE